MPVARTRSAVAGVEDRGGPLEALRFLAAAFIVLYHIGPEAPVHLADVSPIFARGWLATDFFLMLSGFILGRAYGRSLDEGRVSGFVAHVVRVGIRLGAWGRPRSGSHYGLRTCETPAPNV